MPQSEHQLVQLARDSRDNLSHVPYSGFRVGAAVSTPDRAYYGGNVEFAGRFGIHAEQMAVAKALADGVRHIDTIAVSCSDEGGHVPCGMCLHCLSEYNSDMLILVDDGEGWEYTSLNEEMPNAWSGSNR